MPGEAAVARAIGKKLTALALKKAASRMLGKMAVQSRFWNRAFEHISEHFGPIAGKATHTIFESQFRNKAAVEELLRTALRKLGRQPVLSTQSGEVRIIIEKEFAEVIGREQSSNAACKILRIVADATGKPISAFPVKEFFGVTAVAAAFTAAEGEAEAAVPRLVAVEETYAGEFDAQHDMQQDRCDKLDPWFIRLIDMLTFDASCTALDPHELTSPGAVEARANAAIQAIEAKLNIKLDAATHESIRNDIRGIWGFPRLD